MANSRSLRDLRQYWDDLVLGKPVSRDQVDLETAALLAQLHTAPDGQPDPAFIASLRERLVHASTIPLSPTTPPSVNGKTTPLPADLPGVLPPARPPAHPSPWAHIAVVLLLIATLLAAYVTMTRHEEYATIVPAVATPPAAEPSPEGWPMYRGNASRSGVMPGPGMISGAGIYWQFDAGAALSAAAPIADGVLYVAADSGALYALDAASGAVRWQLPAAFATPAWSNGVLYYAAPDSALVARDLATGQELWRTTPDSHVWSLLAADGVVYHGAAAHLLIARDARTGDELWAAQQTTQASGAAALAEGILVVGSDDHTLYGLDSATGATKWHVPLGDDASTIGTPTIDGGAVFVGTSGGDQNVFVGLDLQTGSDRWRIEGEHGESFETPGAAKGRVFVPSSAGTLRALDAATGDVDWTADTSGGVRAGPAIVREAVYVAGKDGVLRTLAVTSGADYGTFPLHDPIVFGPEVVDHQIYVGTESGVVYDVGDIDRPRPTAIPAASATPVP